MQMPADPVPTLRQAALALPRWLKPENADNRLFLAGGRLRALCHDSPLTGCYGRLHLVPQEVQAQHVARVQGLQAVRDATSDTQAPPAMEAAVQARLAEYPDKVPQHTQGTC